MRRAALWAALPLSVPLGRAGETLFASNLGGVHLVRGDDPSPAIRHTRRKTMRHWITSFRLVDGSPNMEGFAAVRKTRRSGFHRVGQAKRAHAAHAVVGFAERV